MATDFSVLFVCLGNICRSPTAHAVFRQKALAKGLNVAIESAGTIAAHAGEPPDRRSADHGQRRGYDFSGIYSQKIKPTDFENYDLILAMDNSNLADLMSICPKHHQHKVRLFLSFADDVNDTQVPDPYYGGSQGFETVLNLVETASDGLLLYIYNKISK